ncbi:MAG: hypothetical protein ACLTX6_00855 [Lachnospiraceae bacterium]
MDRGSIRSIKYISCINVRLAHQIPGCAGRRSMPLSEKEKSVIHF